MDISAAVKWRFNPTNFKCMFQGGAYFSCPFLDPTQRGSEFLPLPFPATISFFSSQRKKRKKRIWLRDGFQFFSFFSGEISFPHSVSAPMREKMEEGEPSLPPRSAGQLLWPPDIVCGVKLGRLRNKEYWLASGQCVQPRNCELLSHSFTKILSCLAVAKLASP